MALDVRGWRYGRSVSAVDVIVDSSEPAPLARFWSQMLERPITRSSDDHADVSLRASGDLVFTRLSAGTKPVKNRLHPDLATTSPGDQDALVQLGLDLGASLVDVGQGAVPWVVMADPEGNEFCVLEPREEYLGIGRLAAVVIDALDPVAQVHFWAHATGLPMAREHPEFASLRQDGGFWLEFVRVDETKRHPNRVHVDLVVDDPVPTTVDRLNSAGAQPVSGWHGDGPMLADPEGNEFCVRRRTAP